jgi:hypothetical protein
VCGIISLDSVGNVGHKQNVVELIFGKKRIDLFVVKRYVNILNFGIIGDKVREHRGDASVSDDQKFFAGGARRLQLEQRCGGAEIKGISRRGGVEIVI